MAAGGLLAGDAAARWRGYPLDSGGDEVLDAFTDGLTALLVGAVAAAGEQIAAGWRSEPGAPESGTPASAVDDEGRERVGLLVRRWRRCLEELAEDEVRTWGNPPAADAEEAAAHLAVALLGGPEVGAGAYEALRRTYGTHCAARLREGGEHFLGTCVQRVLHGERERRLRPLDDLSATPDPQVELIAAFSVLRRTATAHLVP
ncbi:hypothetical protein N566_27405 [Streptomycetaceae bacterium MP113-05]|nr:hypothetical protein N566_27405 [Streptomycetaceae bacterium MP113-05]